jgi:hypothetical protein
VEADQLDQIQLVVLELLAKEMLAAHQLMMAAPAAAAPVLLEATHLHQEQVAQTVVMDLLLHYQELQ